MKMMRRSSRSFMLAVIGALAFAFCGLATAEPMKQRGFGSPVDAAAQAMPDQSAATVAVVMPADEIAADTRPSAKLAKCRTAMLRECISVKTGGQAAVINQNGIQADRGDKVRWS